MLLKLLKTQDLKTERMEIFNVPKLSMITPTSITRKMSTNYKGVTRKKVIWENRTTLELKLHIRILRIVQKQT